MTTPNQNVALQRRAVEALERIAEALTKMADESTSITTEFYLDDAFKEAYERIVRPTPPPVSTAKQTKGVDSAAENTNE